MDDGKYIIIKLKGHEQAILFDSLIAHSDFMSCFHRDLIVAAGFFTVGAEPSKEDSGDISVCVWGNSVTLEIKSRNGMDEKLIKKILRKEYKY